MDTGLSKLSDLTDQQLADCLLMCNAGFIPARNVMVEAARRLLAYATADAARKAAADPQRTRRARAAARSRRYRQLGRESRGSHTWWQWNQRVRMFGWRCAYCRIELTAKSLTKDHQIPLTRGGSQWPANLVPSCLRCNSQKQDRTPTEYRAALAAGGLA